MEFAYRSDQIMVTIVFAIGLFTGLIIGAAFTAWTLLSKKVYRQKHQCAVCARRDCRLYRQYGGIIEADSIRCRSHLPAGDRVGQYNVPSWMVPLVEDDDGGIHNHTGATPEAMQRWVDLPEAEEKKSDDRRIVR